MSLVIWYPCWPQFVYTFEKVCSVSIHMHQIRIRCNILKKSQHKQTRYHKYKLHLYGGQFHNVNYFRKCTIAVSCAIAQVVRAGCWPSTSVFSPGWHQVRSEFNELAVELVFLRIRRFFPSKHRSTLLHTHPSPPYEVCDTAVQAPRSQTLRPNVRTPSVTQPLAFLRLSKTAKTCFTIIYKTYRSVLNDSCFTHR
jgi:hypothetical protein